MLRFMRLILTCALALVVLYWLFASSEPPESIAAHVHGPHDGMVASFQDGTETGHLELKLHDDKGDLELWLGRDAAFSTPFDLPIDATVEVEFTDKDGRKVTLRARNQAQNEDESGKPNARDGKTNYFVFPTQPNEDAAWLTAEKFSSLVVVRFTRDGREFVSQKMEFVIVLVPLFWWYTPPVLLRDELLL